MWREDERKEKEQAQEVFVKARTHNRFLRMTDGKGDIGQYLD